MIIATDAPLTPLGLRRVARRASFGLARTGGIASHGSGDIALAFSTVPIFSAEVDDAEMVAEHITQFFRACIESVEEAIINSLLRAHRVVGRDGNYADAIPIDKVITMLKRKR